MLNEVDAVPMKFIWFIPFINFTVHLLLNFGIFTVANVGSCLQLLIQYLLPKTIMDLVLTQPPRELLRMPCGLLRQSTSKKKSKNAFCLTCFDWICVECEVSLLMG